MLFHLSRTSPVLGFKEISKHLEPEKALKQRSEVKRAQRPSLKQLLTGGYQVDRCFDHF